MEYQTVAYKGESKDERFGWEFGKEIIFQSQKYADVQAAMKEFNAFLLPGDAWFAYLREIENDKIVSEEMFDSSVIKEG